MIRNALLTASLAAGLSIAMAAPAEAGGRYGGGCKRNCGSTRVPEPGMLGLMGAGLAALAVARRKRARGN